MGPMGRMGLMSPRGPIRIRTLLVFSSLMPQSLDKPLLELLQLLELLELLSRGPAQEL
jgi:hypothetical protein